MLSSAASLSHGPGIVWFEGLSGAGKTTIARTLHQTLDGRGCKAFLLDGDSMRKGLSSDLGFSAADRSENLRRAAEVASLLAADGFLVLAAFITPTQADRNLVRRHLGEHPFVEVFVDTELSVAEGRDPKGLYRRARLGEIPDFTGVSAPFEVPASPDVRLDTLTRSPVELAGQVMDHLFEHGVLRPHVPVKSS